MTAKKAMTVSELARLGGTARAQKLTSEERSASARKAVEARWAKTREGIKAVKDDADALLKKTQAAEKRAAKKQARKPAK